jgi:O-antigen ligase
LLVTQNEFVSSLLARNSVEDYISGSNRVTTWLKALAFIATWSPSHWLGYGDAPSWILPLGLNWLHVHNAYMQLFFEAGIVGLASAVAILSFTIHRLGQMIAAEDVMARGLLTFLLAWSLLAAVEPSFRTYSIVHMLFLTAVIVTDHAFLLHRRRIRAHEGPLTSELTSGRAGTGGAS